MKQFWEKVSLLSLSLMLVSTFAVSPALPQMLGYYQKQGYGQSQVELLFSLSSFAILGILLLTPWVSRLLSEKQTIVIGLLLLALAGSLPAVTQSYPLVFLSRLLLGAGIGLINARAITIISEHFVGKERVQMLGLRGSVEVLGSAFFTLLVGFLLKWDWSKSFLIYSFAFVILALYLFLVPKADSRKKTLANLQEAAEKQRLTFLQIRYLLGLAGYAGFVILVNSANTLRIPVVIHQLQLGTESQSSFILSMMMLMGILSGLVFSPFLELLKTYLKAAVVLILGFGMLVLWFATNLWQIGLGALITGFVYSLGVTLVFQEVAENIPQALRNTGTTLVLLGCNLGGGFASLVLQVFALFDKRVTISFLWLAVLSLALGILLLLPAFNRKTRLGDI